MILIIEQKKAAAIWTKEKRFSKERSDISTLRGKIAFSGANRRNKKERFL